MPARSKAQQRLMAAAEHGATFPMAKKLRRSMSHEQLHDFAVGKMKGKPEHVKHARAKQSERSGRPRAPEHTTGNRYSRLRHG